jgi:hypothetical protein
MRETKDFKFSLSKVDDEAGTFDGYASVFGVTDSYNDVVEAGAFKKTLKENDVFPLLWSHDVTQPIGKVTGHEDNKGLKVHGDLNLDVPSAREKHSLMKQGVIKAMSIGYEAVKAPYDDRDKVRRLQEIKLWEVSLVVFPANRKATIGNIKSVADLSAMLESILTMDIKTIDKDKRELAVKAIDRIKALLDDEPPVGTQPITEPSLEPLFAAVREAQRHIQQI